MLWRHPLDNSPLLLRVVAYFVIACAATLLPAELPSLNAAEKSITLRGRVDLAGLEVPPGPFTVRALRPQKRDIEVGKTTTDGNGAFQLAVDNEALALYGVVLEAGSTTNRAVSLEAAVLRPGEAASPIAVNVTSTVEAAIVNWKVLLHGSDFDSIRPSLLSNWIGPIAASKTREGLKRAQALLVKWAVGAAPQSKTAAIVLRSAVGDIRLMTKRLSDLGIAPAAIAELEATARKDAEVAYVLMMPYFLDL